MAGLETLRDGASQRSLLAALVDCNVLTMEQGSWIHNRVEAYKRERSRAIYAHMLLEEGVSQGSLSQLHQQVGDVELDAYGDVVRARRLIPPEREQQLRFQARLAFDRDMDNQVQTLLQSFGQQPFAQLGQTPPQLTQPPTQRLGRLQPVNPTSSQVIRNLPEADASDEVRALIKGTLSDADGELPGPAFRIPHSVDMSDAKTGKQVGDYRILGRIGAGAMGTVYLVDTQSEPEKPIALKLLPKDAGSDAIGRFKREILANSFFSHPGALDVYDAGQTDQGYHYLAMEYFEGEDLEQVLEAAGKLPVKTALELARQVYTTLGAAHESGVVHRDVKPSNVLVDKDYSNARLMDFGIAIIKELDTFEQKVFHTIEGGVTGTPEYMSPEQAAGETLTPSSDLYSMGVVLYHMLSGRLPFESETSGGVITRHMIEAPLPLTKADSSLKGQPKELSQLVDRLLDKNPAKRPDLAEVLGTIDAVLPRVSERGGTSRLLSFLGWRKG